MKTALSVSSLLLALFVAAPLSARAAAEAPPPFTAENCSAARQALDAMGALLHDAKTIGVEKLAFDLEPHLEGLLANRPSLPAQRTEASRLLGDIRDSIELMRGSPKDSVRQLALQRLQQDHGYYSTVLEAAGCPPTAR